MLSYLDDILFLGDDYENLYTCCEILISLFYAVLDFEKNNDYVYGTYGRYIYKYHYNPQDIIESRGYKISKSIGIFDNLSEFDIKKFNNNYVKFIRGR